MKSSRQTKIVIQKNILLSQYSNYKIGGRARYFFEAKNLEEIKETIKWARGKNQKFFILGGGTNLLISDNGFDGLILRINIQHLISNRNQVTAGAGVLMEDLLNFTVEEALTGLEWAGGLPGMLGGAIYGNAGAFGGEIKNSILSVESFDTESLTTIQRNNSECNFKYRNSIFKEKNGKEIILEATLKLEKGSPGDIKTSIKQRIAYRAKYQPLEYPNIGSIFKNVPLTQINADITRINADTIRVNPRGGNQGKSAFTAPMKIDPFPVVPTAYLISQTGLKAKRVGGAMISPKHPNFIINVNDATAGDVKSLINLVESEIKKKFNIELEKEVQIL